MTKATRKVSLLTWLVGWCLCLLMCETNAFLSPRQHSTVVVIVSSSALRPRKKAPQSSTSAHQDRTSTTTKNHVTTDNDTVAASPSSSSSPPLNEQDFLTNMDASLEDLIQQQEKLLQSLVKSSNDKDKEKNNVVVVTKQDQMDRQYQPFAKLARQAAQLNAKYAQEIGDIRSSTKTMATTPPKGLAKPTKALASLASLVAVATVAMLDMPSSLEILLPRDNGILDEFISNAMDKVNVQDNNIVNGFISNVKDTFSTLVASPPSPTATSPIAVESASSIAVAPPVAEIVPEPTVTSSTAYEFKDFSQLDIYGSSTSVDGWFSNTK